LDNEVTIVTRAGLSCARGQSLVCMKATISAIKHDHTIAIEKIPEHTLDPVPRWTVETGGVPCRMVHARVGPRRFPTGILWKTVPVQRLVTPEGVGCASSMLKLLSLPRGGIHSPDSPGRVGWDTMSLCADSPFTGRQRL
jgi:hypothetical protein